VVLQFIQVPIAGSLARRVRRHEAEQSRLLELTVSVSERERIRIAADLHDGPIQNLAGAGYALESIEPSVPEKQAPLMRAIQDTVRRAIESLRWLMVDLYPPDLSASQLPGTIARLAEPLREGGIDVRMTAGPLPDELAEDVLTTLYRVAREALANVSEHALADQVQIHLGITAGADGPKTVHLVIVDNGIGLDPEDIDRRDEGHLGLRLLKDRVENSGGTWSVTSGADGGGTAVSAVLPLSGRPDRRAARARDSGPASRSPSGAPTRRR
jgi:signal transduction histidine kinase